MLQTNNASTNARSSIPIVTLSIIILCGIVYLWQCLSSPFVHNYTMNPRSILFLNEYYRFVTSSVMHGSPMHIIMNMLSFLTIGSNLERQLGSPWLLFSIAWSILMVGTMNVLISYGLVYWILSMDKLMYSHGIGFSGVLFHLLVLQVHMDTGGSGTAYHNVFGLFKVNSKLYPWVSLIMIQFLLPNVSFIGHLCGILCGYLQIFQLLDLLPSGEFLTRLDTTIIPQIITKQNNYIPTNELSILAMKQQQAHGVRGMMWYGIKILWKFIRNILETIRVIIFGHPNAQYENENIRFSGSGMRLGSSSDVERGDTVELIRPPPKPEPFPRCDNSIV